ncbi:alpha/beta fold hydrolase [Nonomuraea diastatica]|uniref:alpha/beta fold hydrolase n=1 Tax=Nonomuraea diastatica TaxID=1848329 RepID=UPI001C6FFE73
MSPPSATPLFRANGPLPGSVHVTALGPHGAPPVLFVHGSTSWGDDPSYGFAAQAPLAGRVRLLLMDRRGYGRSPDAGERFPGDYLADADDIAELLGDGAHLVGHSYGGVGAMIAAVRRPEGGALAHADRARRLSGRGRRPCRGGGPARQPYGLRRAPRTDAGAVAAGLRRLDRQPAAGGERAAAACRRHRAARTGVLGGRDPAPRVAGGRVPQAGDLGNVGDRARAVP